MLTIEIITRVTDYCRHNAIHAICLLLVNEQVKSSLKTVDLPLFHKLWSLPIYFANKKCSFR